jgi:hypothetical protein
VKFDGNECRAGRLVIYHSQNAHPTGPGPKVGFYMIAQSCPDDASFQTFTQRLEKVEIKVAPDGDLWDATLHDGSTSLEAAIDLHQKIPAIRKVDGQAMESTPLSINGKDYTGLLVEPDK